MADNVDTPGVEEPASSPASEATVDNAAKLSELVKEVIANELKPIKGEISGLYSRQDKDRNTLSEFMDEFKKLKADGLTDDAAHVAAEATIKTREQSNKQAEVINALAEKFLDEPSTQPAGSGTSGAIEAVDAIKMLDEYNVSANSPEFLELLRKGTDKLSVERFILDNVKPKPGASPAGIATSAAVSQRAADSDIEELTDEYIKNYSVALEENNREKATNIRREYRKKGVNVDRVRWEVS